MADEQVSHLTKVCKKCGELKSIVAFGPDRQRSDNRRPWCRLCHSLHERERRWKNPEIHREREAARRRADVPKALIKEKKAREKRRATFMKVVDAYREAQRSNNETLVSELQSALTAFPQWRKASKWDWKRKCEGCGGEFTRVYGERREKYCSSVCLRKVHDKKRAGTRTGARRRARAFGVAYEYINRIAVFERDGWKCQICGCKTPKAWIGTHRKQAPELDHRIPMSRGGGHIWENVQCACRECNGAKSDRHIVGQLSLFALPRDVDAGERVFFDPLSSVSLTCRHCGTGFEGRRNRSFCSKPCQVKYQIKLRAAKNAAAKAEGTYVTRVRRSRAIGAGPFDMATPRRKPAAVVSPAATGPDASLVQVIDFTW